MVLWIAPELNHYRIHGLNLISRKTSGLRVIHGMANEIDGHMPLKEEDIIFDRIVVRGAYRTFNWSIQVYRHLMHELSERQYEAVLMPMEKKFLGLILFLFVLKKVFHFRLVTYNHHLKPGKSGYGRVASYFDRKAVYFISRLYDSVGYYTEAGMDLSVREGLIGKEKAFFANNTIDVERVFRIAEPTGTPPEPNVLFIGRLVPYKRVDILLEYFEEIKKTLKACKLFIIGDGPDLSQCRERSKHMKDVFWLGGIADQQIIGRYMALSRIVFVPGDSGLSINLGFAFKKPYVTMQSSGHGPEISYIKDGINGLVLPVDDKENNIRKIITLLTDDQYYAKMSDAAYATAKNLTLDEWAERISVALRGGESHIP